MVTLLERAHTIYGMHKRPYTAYIRSYSTGQLGYIHNTKGALEPTVDSIELLLQKQELDTLYFEVGLSSVFMLRSLLDVKY